VSKKGEKPLEELVPTKPKEAGKGGEEVKGS
jgi:hypothetical protein